MDKYEIVTKFDGSDEWTNDGIGTENVFDTLEEAQQGVASLIALGEEWAAASYAVRSIGARNVL